MMATPAAPPPAQGGRLNVIALISGGKDSFFSLLHCIAHGHRVVALANLHPPETNEHKGSQQEEEEEEGEEEVEKNKTFSPPIMGADQTKEVWRNEQTGMETPYFPGGVNMTAATLILKSRAAVQIYETDSGAA